jgi:hypothetical protein
MIRVSWFLGTQLQRSRDRPKRCTGYESKTLGRGERENSAAGSRSPLLSAVRTGTYSVRKKKCQAASTSACTIAEAKIDPVLRHVQP